jgi:hypothetical protein
VADGNDEFFQAFVEANGAVYSAARKHRDPYLLSYRISEGTNETAGVLIAICESHGWRAPLEIAADSIRKTKENAADPAAKALQDERLACIGRALSSMPAGRPSGNPMAGKAHLRANGEQLRRGIRL